MADRQGPDSKEYFQPVERTIPIYIRAAHFNLPQTLSQKPGPWPTVREGCPCFCQSREIKLSV